MALESLWTAMENLGVSSTIREVPFAFAAVEIVHVFAVCAVFGSILIVDLRLLGLASNKLRVTTLSNDLLRWTWIGFGFAAVSGFFMFMARAGEYMLNNMEFKEKMVLLVLAAINMAIFHFGAFKRVSDWDVGPTPAAAKVAGALSLLFWLSIVTLGRVIGFTIGLHF